MEGELFVAEVVPEGFGEEVGGGELAEGQLDYAADEGSCGEGWVVGEGVR